MKQDANLFATLAAINVNDHVEKKNGLSYLSWAWAWDQLMRVDPAATVEYHEPQAFGKTLMVSCTVTVKGIARRMHLPVMNHRNQAIAEPDAFAVNTAMQRCLVKAIAMHGLGLYIYAGEDLPLADGEEEKAPVGSARRAVQDAFTAMDVEEQKFLSELATQVKADIAHGATETGILRLRNLDTDEKAAIWSLFDSKERAAIKKAQEAEKAKAAVEKTVEMAGAL